MAWFKVDDGFNTHPKVMAIPRRDRMACLGLWLTAGVWSAQQLTDGFVPYYMLDEFGADMSQGDILGQVGLWRKVEDGYQFHDWNEYQPRRSEIEQRRDMERQRKAEWRAKKAAKAAATSGDADANVPDMSHGTETPRDEMSPLSRPDPTRPDPLIKRVGASDEALPSKKGERVKPDWMPRQDIIDEVKAEYPALDLKAEHQAFIDYWLAKPGQRALKLDWDRTWRTWMKKNGKEQAEKARSGYRNLNQIMQDERARAQQQTAAMQGNALNLIEGGNQ